MLVSLVLFCNHRTMHGYLYDYTGSFQFDCSIFRNSVMDLNFALWHFSSQTFITTSNISNLHCIPSSRSAFLSQIYHDDDLDLVNFDLATSSLVFDPGRTTSTYIHFCAKPTLYYQLQKCILYWSFLVFMFGAIWIKNRSIHFFFKSNFFSFFQVLCDFDQQRKTTFKVRLVSNSTRSTLTWSGTKIFSLKCIGKKM